MSRVLAYLRAHPFSWKVPAVILLLLLGLVLATTVMSQRAPPIYSAR
jgi:hypothetical protein